VIMVTRDPRRRPVSHATRQSVKAGDQGGSGFVGPDQFGR
jgi:hypothetical protein